MRLDLRLRGRSLRAKLTLTYLVILAAGALVTSLVGSWIVSSTIMQQAQRAVEHDLATARTNYEHELGSIEQVVALTAAALGERVARVLPADRDLGARLATTQAEAGLDFLTLTDAAGRVIVRSAPAAGTGDTVADSPVVAAALAGAPEATTALLGAEHLDREAPGLAERAYLPPATDADSVLDAPTAVTNGLVLLAAAPIRDGRGRLVGTLYGGRLLNSRYDIVDRVWSLLYRREQGEGPAVGVVTIFAGDVRVATTIRTHAGARAVGTRASPEVGSAIRQGLDWRDRAFVVNDWYVAAYDPIRDVDGAVVGAISVGVLERTYATIRDRVILSFYGLASIGFVLILGVTYVMIGNLTRPIGEMVAVTRSIAAGRLDQSVRPPGHHELAALAESFNTMLASVRQMKADLEEWGRTLEEKVRERTEQVMEMQARVAQSERLASLGMLAAGVAHEVNNPLGGILALTALTLEDLPADHPDRHNLEVVLRQTERCRDIVKGLLDFSRQSDATMVELNVNEVLDQTLALVGGQSAFINVEVVRNWADGLPRVVGDRSQLQQVFLNMLVNAVQAMDERGTVTITTRASHDRGSVEVLIADSGCGIQPDVIDRVFDPFFTTKQGSRGTGLGLAIAYGIVTHHRGHIRVASDVGRGTTFTIQLPAAG